MTNSVRMPIRGSFTLQKKMPAVAADSGAPRTMPLAASKAVMSAPKVTYSRAAPAP